MECCFNFCTLLSCIGDCKNAVSKLLPCLTKTEEVKYKEETFKITFFGRSIIKFEKLEEIL